MGTESRDSGIDPRYAPQFQRGFDPAQHAAEPALRGPVRIAGGSPPTAVRVPDPPRLRTAPIETAEPAAAGSDGVEPSIVEPSIVEPDPPLRGTRWDWLLPGLGGVLVLFAFGLWWSWGTDTGAYYGTSPNDEWQVFWQQLRWVLPGPLLTAGAVAMTAGVVLQALRPRE